MSYHETQSGKQFALVQGEGTPILLLHGFPLSHRMWREQVVALSKVGQVIIPDLSGFGQTPLTREFTDSEEPNIAGYAQALIGLIETIVAPAQKLHVAGLSMGGYVAMALARLAPERFASLILCNTKAEGDSKEAAEKRRAMASQLLVDGSRVAVEAMLPNVMAPGVNEEAPALFDFVRNLMLSQPPKGLATAQKAMATRPDSTELLSNLPCPILLIAGDQDKITPAEGMQKLAQKIPSAEFVLIPGAGHLSVLEQPALVNESIIQFLQTVVV